MAPMHISARGEYGLRALLDLALHSGRGAVRANEIAERQKIPLSYLEQLLCILKRTGIVKSTRGPKGGFELARRPQQITVKEVLFCLEGNLDPHECVSHECPEDAARTKTCAVRTIWSRVAEAVHKVLDKMTLARLVEEQLSLDAGAKAMYHI